MGWGGLSAGKRFQLIARRAAPAHLEQPGSLAMLEWMPWRTAADLLAGFYTENDFTLAICIPSIPLTELPHASPFTHTAGSPHITDVPTPLTRSPPGATLATSPRTPSPWLTGSPGKIVVLVICGCPLTSTGSIDSVIAVFEATHTYTLH